MGLIYTRQRRHLGQFFLVTSGPYSRRCYYLKTVRLGLLAQVEDRLGDGAGLQLLYGGLVVLQGEDSHAQPGGDTALHCTALHNNIHMQIPDFLFTLGKSGFNAVRLAPR